MTTPDDGGFVSLLTARAAAEPERVYARFCGEPATYGEIDRRSAAFAAHLRASGIAAGERVAVMMRNSIAAIAVVFGLARAGVAWVPVNAQQRGEGLRYLLTHSQPRLLVADAELVPQIAEATASGPSFRFSSTRPAENSTPSSPAPGVSKTLRRRPMPSSRSCTPPERPDSRRA